MKHKILITGINGFVGKHLVRCLDSAGYEVHGLTLNEPISAEIKGIVKTNTRCDLADKASVDRLKISHFDAIINLAGLANVGASFDSPKLYMKVNVDVLRNLGEKILRESLPTRLLAVSTGAVYSSNQKLPLTEESETTNQTSPYAKSKLKMEDIALSMVKRGLDCIIVRPFNHIGPGQAPGFLLPDLYEKINISLESRESITLGNIKTRRDYTDVRDVVEAYRLLATLPSNKLKHNLYNVCSGTAHSGEEILSLLLSKIEGAKKIPFSIDKSLFRKNDPSELRGSNDRLRNDTGWGPKISLRDTVADFVDWKLQAK